MYQDFAAAGLKNVHVDTRDLRLTPRGEVGALAALCLVIGPAASTAEEMGASRAQLQELRLALIDQMSQFGTSDGLLSPAVIHIITARTWHRR